MSLCCTRLYGRQAQLRIGNLMRTGGQFGISSTVYQIITVQILQTVSGAIMGPGAPVLPHVIKAFKQGRFLCNKLSKTIKYASLLYSRLRTVLRREQSGGRPCAGSAKETQPCSVQSCFK